MKDQVKIKLIRYLIHEHNQSVPTPPFIFSELVIVTGTEDFMNYPIHFRYIW